MAITNFIPTIWEARLMAKFHERSVAEVITTAPTKIEGNKIIFNKVSDVAIKDYEGSVSFDDLTTSKVELPLDIKKYWAFKVDDVDAVQAAGNLIDPHVSEAAFGLQEATDAAVFAEALKTSNEVTGEKAYDIIVKANTQLNKNKVPKADRYIVINAEVLEDLQLDSRFTEHYTILENGIMEGAKINGVQLVFSEELNGGSYAIVALHKSAIGFGKQLQETEAMRLQNSFADGVRGLQVCGTKILREEAIVKCVKA
ncbi:MAG: hypothetical protein J6D47_12635 [Peptostreptococcaceae bacterium]|jgi:hypothetical protein|nr:hypothetical protein [Peptostreptococcaceae bacterium]